MFKKLQNTIFDVSAGPMILIFGGVLFLIAILVVCFIVIAIKLIKGIIKKNSLNSNDDKSDTKH